MDILRYLDVPLVLGAVAVVVLVTALAGVPALRRGDRRGAARTCVRVLLAGAVATVLVMTLVAGSAWGAGSYNLVPGTTIAAQLASSNGSLALGNLAGNVLVFVPIGLLGVLGTRCRPGTVVAAGGGLSVAIELSQYVTGRSADVDDVLLNTLGTAVGVAVAVAGLRLAGTVRTGAPGRAG
ncbi:VanZ family protein [Goekera deserti]|uniref:VanZ family protein n=1 Tax=Goekera deserti TaxID=2497753 RepID=A0A7K3WJP7_9ACTN|nr:VanZ family protein [Goekera deserti]NDI50491.1 hypothetical protein [Goekera deserti]NEL56586.1 VanZ family protein [Goekera deserti]